MRRPPFALAVLLLAGCGGGSDQPAAPPPDTGEVSSLADESVAAAERAMDEMPPITTGNVALDNADDTPGDLTEDAPTAAGNDRTGG